MPRELEGYRPQLELLTDKCRIAHFSNHAALVTGINISVKIVGCLSNCSSAW